MDRIAVTGSKQNIRHLLGCDRFERLRHGVTFPLYVEFDRIFNLACPASPIHYQLCGRPHRGHAAHDGCAGRRRRSDQSRQSR